MKSSPIKVNKRKALFVLIDTIILFLASFLPALIYRVLGIASIQSGSTRLYAIAVFAFVILGLLSLFIAGEYSRAWKKLSKRAYANIVVMNLIATLLTMLLIYIIAPLINDQLLKNAPLYFLTSYVLSTGVMVLFRRGASRYYNILIGALDKENGKRALIVGAGSAGQIIASEVRQPSYLENKKNKRYNIICFVDDDPNKLNAEIDGINVLGTTDDLPYLCRELEIETIFFAIPSCPDKIKSEILNKCTKTECEVKIIPNLSSLISNKSVVTQTRNIVIEDLLGRDPIKFDMAAIKEDLKGKVCMVTGGGGSIGSELCRQIASFEPKKLVIVDIYENNAYDIQQELVMEYGDTLDLEVYIASVRDREKMQVLFERVKPEVVYHAAAHKHVPLMETSPEEAIKNNVFGTLNVAQLASENEVKKFVMISTDKAVNPTNVMGATKRCCEMVVQTLSQQENSETEFVAVRFGNVLGSNGSVIPLFKRLIEAGKPITVTHPDIIRYFMTIPEAVSLVLEAGSMAKGGEIFVLDMGEPVKILELAENLIRAYGKKPYDDVEIKFTGLRPGEKLFEELLMNEEGLQKTANEKIFIGNQIEIDASEFQKGLDALKKHSSENNTEKVVETLKEVVPTFNHKPNK